MTSLNHDRKLSLGLISLTMEKPRKDDLFMAKEISYSLEKKLIHNHFFENLPFDWIALMIRYGIKDDLQPIVKKINKKFKNIELAIEVYCGGMRQMTVEEFTLFLEKPIYKTMLWICEKYGKNPEFIHEHFRHVALD